MIYGPPRRQKNGERRYQCWAGDPDGHSEDLECCIAQVAGDIFTHFPQCSRKRGHGPDGEYCKQHAKMIASAEANPEIGHD